MAKRRNKYVFAGQRPAQIDSMDQSRFWQRLDELSRVEKSQDRKREIDHLKASIRKVTEQAKWISTQVCRFMPQYTLHAERHFLNVLAIMDALVPDEVIARFGALDCGLPILAAYTHDLGMALSQDEYDRLHDESTEQGKHFASYRTRFDEELRQLERWKKKLPLPPGEGRGEGSSVSASSSPEEIAAARKRIESIEGHILASYLRETHTEDDQLRRLRRWLDIIKQETGDENVFRYGVGGKDYQRELALIGISHGRGAPWLRRQLIDGGPDDRFFQPVATGESANLAFPGLLLRLADVMDFDASRAPRILFKHFGIENDQSVLEWNKHLSVVGWRLDVDPDGKQQPDLLYSAECQHPVHEKAIREFKTWIDAELAAVRIELDAQRRQLPTAAQPRYDLHLPSQTRLDIRSARDPLTDQPKYVYHDLQFRLDQDEIQQLLMGESLYGDPGLCIRELLQNALDALELRELRLKMKQKGEAREPVDGELIRPGWVREPDGHEEELRVTLDWGTDEETGQQWLRVTDNGVGMTEEVIQNYFTQIGKSYYRSPEFNQERAAMRAAGEVVSPISIFGIGILSCFMIADRIRVRTQSGNGAFDVDISGPGSLFYIQLGTRPCQGTEITVSLKPRFTFQHEGRRFLARLKDHFGYLRSEEFWGKKEDRRVIDVPMCAASSVLWPRYPVVLAANVDIRIDDRFHIDHIAPIDSEQVAATARYFGCPRSFLGTPQWGVFDWVDDGVTGSRIRLWYASDGANDEGIPKDPPSSDLNPRCRQCDLARFSDDFHNRGMNFMVRGMHVDRISVCYDYDKEFIRFEPFVATRVWIDLHGDASPNLNLSRTEAIEPTDPVAWRSIVTQLLRRFESDLHSLLLIPGNESARRNILSSIYVKSDSCLWSIETQPKRSLDLLTALGKEWDSSGRRQLLFAYDRLLESAYRKPLSIREHGPPSEDEEIKLSNMLSMGVPELSAGGRDDLTDEQRTTARLCRMSRVALRTARGSASCHEPLRNRLDGLTYQLKPKFCQVTPDQAHKNLVNSKLKWHVFKDGRQIEETDEDLWNRAHQISRDSVETVEAEFTDRFMKEVPEMEFWLAASFLQEAFMPRLEESWPLFALAPLQGKVGEATISAPGEIQFDINNDNLLRFADAKGESPLQLVRRGYDLTFPMTAVPLGQLRRECEKWRSDRWYRPLGVAPFLLPALHDVWPAHAEFLQETFNVPHIYCLLPRFELWSKRFCDWTDADWHDPENLSALWDLSGHLTGTPGQVLWARGTYDINEMPKVGLPAPEFLDANTT